MVKRLHDAGIEVLLDVVYNHTAEGNEFGPTLSFRGIDNASYYRLMPTTAASTSTIPAAATPQPDPSASAAMVMDSLRYWVNDMHVDGFRFDLAVTLGREEYGYDRWGGFFDAIRQDPALSRVKVIAEPWDIGPGGYQLGGFPAGTTEWNDRFRDTTRRFWCGDDGMLPRLASNLLASSDLFDHDCRRPWARSITSPATTVSPWPTWSAAQRTPQRGQRRKQPRWPSFEFQHNQGVRRIHRRPGHPAVAPTPAPQHVGHRVVGSGHAHAAGRRRIRAHPERQQQRLPPGQ